MRQKFHLFTAITFLIFCGFCFPKVSAQSKTDYDTRWVKIEQLEKKGLTISALSEVEKIYTLSKKDKNEPQIIKSLLFKINLRQNIEEDASIKSIDSLEVEITSSKEPSKSILQSITAQLYWNYLQQNRYKLYQRTNTINFNKKDLATWTSDDFNKRISELFLASLKDEKLLRQTKLEPYDAIISNGNVRHLRPTLYDLLAHRALDYFKTDERDITRPAYAFEIKDGIAFAPAKEFIHTTFISKDTASLHQKALLIFQKLLSFHEEDSSADPLIDVDIERIDFINQYGVMQNKDSLYISALAHLNESFSGNPSSAQAKFLIAQLIYNKAIEAKRNKESSNYTIVKAKEIVDEILQKFPKSEGGINAKNLLKTILHTSINLTTEKINVPSKPFRTLVSYQNLDTVYFRIIALTPELKISLQKEYNNDKLFRKLISLKTVRSWPQNLPKKEDYFLHSVEVKIDALPVGEYALIGSADKNFSLVKNPLAAQYFYVSNISFINSGQQYFVLDRTTGQPLSGAKVQTWNQQYDYNSKDYSFVKKGIYNTDKNGYFRLTLSKNQNDNRNVRLEISTKSDYLFLEDYQYIYYNNYPDTDEKTFVDQKRSDAENAKIFVFTDRSIYRPGQVVYFKGIAITKDFKTQKSILLQSKDSLGLILFDVNNQKIDSIKLLLNNYGSFNGKFTIPENKLSGEFRIEVADYKNSSVSFSVEEYKRPKFYTELNKPAVGFRVGDTVSISGFAKAYAGNNIDGAKVSYRVTRVARFLYPWMFWRKGFPQSRPLEITHGEVTTDMDGKFILRFRAIPDLAIDSNTDPVFDYKIEADVTDINGETRTTNITIPIGYKSLDLQIVLPQEAVINNNDSLLNISISSKNLSGELEKVKAHVKIFSLQQPERLIRQRLWDEPDQFIFNKNEFINYFPHDEYKDETKKESWTKENLIFEKSDSTNTPNFIPSSKHLSFLSGWYVIEATAKDKDGQEVKDVKYFRVYDNQSNKLSTSEYFWNYPEKKNAAPGETVKIITESAAKDVFLIQEINKSKTSDDAQRATNTNFNFSLINNHKNISSFKISETDRGGFGVNEFFVKDNRFHAVSNTIDVPWSNKELNISFDTYRDKTLPGSIEKWKVKISGNKGEKVAAEMLASMYDASLDQFRPHSWSNLKSIWPKYSGYNTWQGRQNFTTVISFEKNRSEKFIPVKEKIYDALNYLPNTNRPEDLIRLGYDSYRKPANSLIVEKRLSAEQVVVTESQNETIDSGRDTEQNNPFEKIDQSQIQIRKNFNETAFFFPELRTDKDGNVEFSFTMPDALTQWKLMALAHTIDLSSGYSEKTIVTQKDLMVQPNAPRFFREGDKIQFSAKVVNLSNKEISGNAKLHLLNASTMNPVDGWFSHANPLKAFTVAAGASVLVTFQIEIPDNFNTAVIYKIIAKAGNISDGEEAAIPVVTNRMLVTETMPLTIRGEGSKDFNFQKLLNSGTAKTLTNYGLTVEYTSNPAWFAVQALPYLVEFPNESTEQTFNRFYGNALASKIVNSSPKLKVVLEKWKETDTSAFMSNLQKNEELKSVLLEETPWVLQSQNELQQKKNIALLFDLVKMNVQLQSSIDKLKEMQSPNGGFVWFKGGPDNRYMTQYIVTGLGHLKKLNALPVNQQISSKAILDLAVPYLDKLLQKDYENLLKSKADIKKENLSNIVIQYLYMRSFFPDYPIAKEAQTAFSYYQDQAKKYWLKQSKYMQGMIALSLNRNSDHASAKAIINSLKENSINNEQLGMYWKEWDRKGYWWYQAPIESQSLMIEAFSEIGKDQKSVDDLKTWLLKNKQTNNWKTTKATADACYAMLLQGNDWLAEEKNITIKLGTVTFNSKNEIQESGTGYFKRKIDGDKVKPEMGNINLTVSSSINKSTTKPINNSPSWGSVYWQYFENLDEITFSETPLKLSKKIFIEKNSDKGPILIPVNNGDKLHIGDKIKVRIVLRVDRDMEYVHMKDMRASCMEPANVISQYKYQDGLGYYETTKDVSTHFFFGYLNKGTYVFEYPMFVTHAGNFSNGITTIQSMYAPEFTAHSEGVRVNVE